MPKKTRADATDKFNIYYPEQNDKVDIAGDFKRLADSVDAALENVDGTGGGPGTPGKDGVDGKSAYELAVEEGFIGTEPEWLESLQGADGADGADGANGTDGEDGKDGSGVSIKGTKTWPEIEKIGNDGDAVDGDMYILKEDSADAPAPAATAVAGDGLVWLENDWANVGPIQGPKGEDGEDGAGLAEGGLANQILVKSTDNDFETEWKPLGTYTDLANFGSVVP